jgi:hypothetical protein
LSQRNTRHQTHEKIESEENKFWPVEKTLSNFIHGNMQEGGNGKEGIQN